MNPIQSTQTNSSPPSFFTKVGTDVKNGVSGIFDMFKPTTYSAPAAASAPAPAAPAPAAPVVQPVPKTPVPQVPTGWTQAIKDAYSYYPSVPKGMTEAILNQESSMGQDTTNKKTDYGGYGYLGGITKTGAFPNTLANEGKTTVPYTILQKDPKGNYVIKNIKTLGDPYSAIQAVNSIVAQHINNHYGGKIDGSAEQAFELYDKYYKSASGTKMTPAQKQKFIDTYNYYGGQKNQVAQARTFNNMQK